MSDLGAHPREWSRKTGQDAALADTLRRNSQLAKHEHRRPRRFLRPRPPDPSAGVGGAQRLFNPGAEGPQRQSELKLEYGQ